MGEYNKSKEIIVIVVMYLKKPSESLVSGIWLSQSINKKSNRKCMSYLLFA